MHLFLGLQNRFLITVNTLFLISVPGLEKCSGIAHILMLTKSEIYPNIVLKIPYFCKKSWSGVVT